MSLVNATNVKGWPRGSRLTVCSPHATVAERSSIAAGAGGAMSEVPKPLPAAARALDERLVGAGGPAPDSALYGAG
jgi:hypothetical protein